MLNKQDFIGMGKGIQINKDFNSGSIAIGDFAKSSGKNSIAIGSSNGALTTMTTAAGDFAIAIGAGVVADTINGLGEIKIGNSQFNAFYYDGGSGWKVGSDVRDKTDIKPITHALDFIKQVQPIRFRYNYRKSYSINNSLTNYDKNEHLQATKAEKLFNYGVSAQEVAQALGSIYGNEYYGNIISKREEASFSRIEDCYSVNMTGFIPFLIEAINEQQEQLELLQQRIKDLEEQING